MRCFLREVAQPSRPPGDSGAQECAAPAEGVARPGTRSRSTCCSRNINRSRTEFAPRSGEGWGVRAGRPTGRVWPTPESDAGRHTPRLWSRKDRPPTIHWCRFCRLHMCVMRRGVCATSQVCVIWLMGDICARRAKTRFALALLLPVFDLRRPLSIAGVQRTPAKVRVAPGPEIGRHHRNPHRQKLSASNLLDQCPRAYGNAMYNQGEAE